MSQKRDNSGTLGANRRKEKDSHPSHTGQCIIEGTEYWVSAWVKEGPTGKFFSLSFKPKDNGNAVAKPKKQAPADEDFSDDIPFVWLVTALFAGLLSLGCFFAVAPSYLA